jgi:hypothetical protein
MTGVDAKGNSGTGIGVAASGATGVIGTSTAATGTGVIGQGGKGPGVIGKRATGIGVVGTSELGVGGEFRGTLAPLRLCPAEGTGGAPTSGAHQAGEMFVDSKANLYFCIIAGTPGQWKQIAMR